MLIGRVIRTFKLACEFWVQDHASQLGAALAYYALFSLAPLLVLAIGLAGLVYGEDAARGHLLERIRDFLGEESAGAVQGMLANFRHPPTSLWAGAVGLATLLFGAVGLFTQLRTSLAFIWRLQPHGQHVLVRFLKDYLLAFLMVLVACIFVLLLLVASTAQSLLFQAWPDLLPGDVWFWQWFDFAISSLLITILFAFTYRFLSDGQVPYRLVWSGALVSAMLFALGKIAIAWYLAYTRLASAYGVAGSLVVFLAWIYYSAQIFLFGAEIVHARLAR